MELKQQRRTDLIAFCYIYIYIYIAPKQEAPATFLLRLKIQVSAPPKRKKSKRRFWELNRTILTLDVTFKTADFVANEKLRSTDFFCLQSVIKNLPVCSASQFFRSSTAFLSNYKIIPFNAVYSASTWDVTVCCGGSHSICLIREKVTTSDGHNCHYLLAYKHEGLIRSWLFTAMGAGTFHSLKSNDSCPAAPFSQHIVHFFHLTWSPRLSPASAALLPSSTDSTKMPNPLSLPPCTLNDSCDSLDAFCRVICLHLALAAHAMFSSRKWPFIFWQGVTHGENADELLFTKGVKTWCTQKNNYVETLWAGEKQQFVYDKLMDWGDQKGTTIKKVKELTETGLMSYCRF